MAKEGIFKAAQRAIVESDASRATELAQRGLAEGIDPMELMNRGFIPGISKVGEVYDIGRNVPNPRFIEEAEKVGADIIGWSALLTTTMDGQKRLEEELNKSGLKDRYKPSLEELL